jgi:hypothetical protein
VTLRNYHEIAVYNSGAAPPGVTIEKAAALLGVSTGTVRRLIGAGLIEARQPVPYAPWAIDPAILSNEAVKRAVEAIRSGGKLPRTAPASPLNLIKSGHSKVGIMSLGETALPHLHPPLLGARLCRIPHFIADLKNGRTSLAARPLNPPHLALDMGQDPILRRLM